MALPKFVFVNEEEERDGSKYLSVCRNQEDAAGEDNYVLVGTYQLVGSARIKQDIHIAVEPERKRKK